MSHRLTKNIIGLSEQAVQLAPYAILIVDSCGIVSHANVKAAEMLLDQRVASNEGFKGIVGQSAQAVLAGIDLATLSSKPIRKNITIGASRRTIEISAVSSVEEDTISTFVYLNDADRQHKRELLLEKEATTDELSGLSNRRAFQRTMEANQHLPLTLAILDIDHFKLINDENGHLAGDEAIRTAGRLLTKSFDKSAIVVSRMGGDEFSVLFETTDVDAILKLLEDYRVLLFQTELTDHGKLHVSVSIGVAFSSNPQTGSRTLLTNADRQLYLAKESGRNKLAHILLT